MKPLLRWVGSKASVAKHLATLLPDDVHTRHWVEPFAGSAAMFWHLRPQSASLNDLNANLIGFYADVQEFPSFLEIEVDHLAAEYDVATDQRATYLAFRERLNTEHPAYSHSALFYALNQTCFNGLWRENAKGHMNVPWGKRKGFELPDLAPYSRALRLVDLTSMDAAHFLASRTWGSLHRIAPAFLFVDPPYYGTFDAYCGGPKGMPFHAGLRDRLAEIREPWMVTYQDNPFVRLIYRDYRIVEFDAPRRVAANGNRKPAKELAIMNY
jgi:DNA adenine methylase